MKTISHFLQINERDSFCTKEEWVNKLLLKIKDDLIEKELGNLEIEKILNKEFIKKRLQFELGFGVSQFDSMNSLGIISAYTNNYGDIVIQYDESFYKTFEDLELYLDFGKVLGRIIQHEIVHRSQIEKIKRNNTSYEVHRILNAISTDPTNRFKYLSNKHEMMAFAVEAVEEFRDLGYTDKEIIKKINSPWGDVEGDIFYMYFDYFDYRGNWLDSKDKRIYKEILNRFTKYMYQYIEKT
jgi:hypothetical protein